MISKYLNQTINNRTITGRKGSEYTFTCNLCPRAGKTSIANLKNHPCGCWRGSKHLGKTYHNRAITGIQGSSYTFTCNDCHQTGKGDIGRLTHSKHRCPKKP